jgi:hypothetical protein
MELLELRSSSRKVDGVENEAFCTLQRQARSTLQCRPEVALQTQDETNGVQSSQVGDEGEKIHVENCRFLVKPIASRRKQPKKEVSLR